RTGRYIGREVTRAYFSASYFIVALLESPDGHLRCLLRSDQQQFGRTVEESPCHGVVVRLGTWPQLFLCGTAAPQPMPPECWQAGPPWSNSMRPDTNRSHTPQIA